jgi:membrane-associated phospholipid phosphatase
MEISLQFWKKLALCIGVYSIFCVIAWIISLFINDPLDRQILLFFNPDTPLPILDEFFIMITDFSIGLCAALMIIWEIGYIISLKTSRGVSLAINVVRTFGIIAAIVILSGTWLFGYNLPGFFPLLALIIGFAFYGVSMTYTRLSPQKLHDIHIMIFIVALSAILSVSGEGIIKEIVQRPRPLNNANSDWNWAIRIFPDEVVKGSFSYFSGHSSGLFAVVTPFAWFSKSKSSRIFLWIWAGLHAFSRVYLAAHFPLCILIGSLSGFIAGTVCYWLFYRKK